MQETVLLRSTIEALCRDRATMLQNIARDVDTNAVRVLAEIDAAAESLVNDTQTIANNFKEVRTRYMSSTCPWRHGWYSCRLSRQSLQTVVMLRAQRAHDSLGADRRQFRAAQFRLRQTCL